MSMDIYKTIASEAARLVPEATEIRQRLHRMPEPSYQESMTSELIREELESYGLTVSKPTATGIVALLEGEKPGPVLALRADMDAVCVEDLDRETATYSHCCGHDGHMACLLGAAKLLVNLKSELSGTVKFIFQPGEECGTGARAMVDAGVLQNPRPEAIVCLHTWPDAELGSVASRPGPITCGTEHFELHIMGRGGHGARVHKLQSPILVAADLIRALHELSEPDRGEESRVVSVGMIHSGTEPNVIPDRAVLEGTIRAGSKLLQTRLRQEIEETVADICDRHEVKFKMAYHGTVPPVINASHLHEVFEAVAQNVLSEGKVSYLESQSMGSEDFSAYLEHIPGMLFRLGVGTPEVPLHSVDFEFNDGALEAGMAVLAAFAIGYGRQQ